MPSKREKLAIGEYSHIYNRGTDKRAIFNKEEDIERFIESMYIFNTIKPTLSLIRKKDYNDYSVGVGPLQEPLVEIVAYSLLPNHFHILVKQIIDGGMSEFMKRLQGGYTSYFNEENKRSGALFQGKYKYKHVDTDEYFRNIFCYVTFNSTVHNFSKDKNHLIASSFGEYISRTSYLIAKSQMDFIFDIFSNTNKIQKFAKDTISVIRKLRSEKDYKENKNLFE
jgi:putative transposase